MEEYRKECIYRGHNIKLTREESKNIVNTLLTPELNSSWLMQDRGELQWTHPEYPGPFIKENTLGYHIYCSMEMWLALGKDPFFHWDYRGDNGWSSYNPTIEMHPHRCHMTLPIVQRKKARYLSYITAEIFDVLTPSYYQFFIKIDWL